VSEHQVAKLILDDVDIDEAGAFVKRGDPKTKAEDFVAAYMKDNAHLAKPKTAKGSGASPFPAAAPSAPTDPIDLSTAEGMTRYVRLLTHGNRPPTRSG
jgi:hypothetical protein